MISGKQIARLVFCFLLILALASCAEQQNHRAPMPIASAKPINSIVLVSTVPNSIAMQYGASIYAQPAKVERVRWDINGRTLSVLRDYLSQAYDVSTADITAASFGPIDFNSGFEELQQLLKGKIGAGKHDLILVIAPIAPSGTSASLWYSPKRDYEIAFTYILVALDGDTFAVSGVGYAEKDYSARIKKLRWTGETFVSMSDIDKRILEPAIYGLIDRNIPRSLEALGLTAART